MTQRAELSLAADGLPEELSLLWVQTGPCCRVLGWLYRSGCCSEASPGFRWSLAIVVSA